MTEREKRGIPHTQREESRERERERERETECLTIGVRSRREREDQRKKEFKGASLKQKYSGLHLNDFLVTSLIKVYPFQSM